MKSLTLAELDTLSAVDIKTVVKIGFSEAAKETTMEEQFESYLRTL